MYCSRDYNYSSRFNQQYEKPTQYSTTRRLRNLIYDYKDAFSLRDEIGTCPNIKVEIDVMDNNPFFIRPFHAKEEDKAISDKEMKRLCYLGILSRQIEDDSNLHKIIPISFNIWEVLQESYHNMVADTYKVQTRAQAKAQTNTSTVVNAQPVAQKFTLQIVKIPTKTEKKKDIKMPPSRIIQQPPRNIVLPPGSVLPPIVMPPSVRLPLKPPNVDKTTAGPDLELDPNMDIEQNSPHQEAVHNQNLCRPR